MKQFNNLSTWREETVVVKGKECFDLNFRDTTPNMFVIQNPNNAELFISISKIPTSKNYEFKVGKNCTDTLGRPTPTNRIYIFNNADIDATIKVFSVMDTFDMNILKNFAVSLDSGEMQMDGVVKGFDSDVSLPAGNNFMGYVGLSDSERQSFADMITSLVAVNSDTTSINEKAASIKDVLSNIKTDTNNMLAIKNNVVNTWDCINKITNMMKGTFTPNSGEVDNVAEIVKKIIDFPTLSEYLFKKELVGSCDLNAVIPDVEMLDGYVTDTVEDLRYLPITSDIKLYIAGSDFVQIGSVIDTNGTEYKIYPRKKVSGGKTKYFVTAYMGNGYYNANIDLDSPIISLSEFVTKFNNCHIMSTVKAMGSCKLAMGFLSLKKGIGGSALSNYYTKTTRDFCKLKMSVSGLLTGDGTWEVTLNSGVAGTSCTAEIVDSAGSHASSSIDLNLIYGCIYTLEDVTNAMLEKIEYMTDTDTAGLTAVIDSVESCYVFSKTYGVYNYSGILAQLMNKIKIPTIMKSGTIGISQTVTFSNEKSTESNPVKIADCIKFIENTSEGDLFVNIYYTFGNYSQFTIPAGGKLENIELPIYAVALIAGDKGNRYNIMGGLYG